MHMSGDLVELVVGPASCLFSTLKLKNIDRETHIMTPWAPPRSKAALKGTNISCMTLQAVRLEVNAHNTCNTPDADHDP